MGLTSLLSRFSRRERRRRRADRRRGFRFEGRFATYAEARDRARGYDAASILEKVLAATLMVKSGEAVFERDSVLFDEIQYSWPFTAALMLAAARNQGRLRVLDFGGALGSSYFQNRRFLGEIGDCAWGIVEQPEFVRAGREHIAGEVLSFHDTIASCRAALGPNVVVAASVLQYLDAPLAFLDELLAVQADVFIVDRTPYRRDGGPSVVTVQQVDAEIYDASYPCWFFGEEEIRARIEAAGYSLVESSLGTDDFGEDVIIKGHVFVRR
jgi:putative methyltransferase (TIGR04325 family)